MTTKHSQTLAVIMAGSVLAWMVGSDVARFIVETMGRLTEMIP